MNSIIHGFRRILTARLHTPACSQVNHSLKHDSQRSLFTLRPVDMANLSMNTDRKKTLLLPPGTSQCTQISGLKYVVNVHRRCKDCYLMLIEGVLHNFCTAHPRHKQRMKTKRPKNTWILTGVTTHTKLRPRR